MIHQVHCPLRDPSQEEEVQPEMKNKRGRAKDKLIGLKSVWETAPETKRICTTTGVIDKVNNSP